MKRILTAVAVYAIARFLAEIAHCMTGAKCQVTPGLAWHHYVTGGLIMFAMLLGAGFLIAVAIEGFLRVLPSKRSFIVILALGIWSGMIGLLPDMIAVLLSGNSIANFRWGLSDTYQFVSGCICGGYLYSTARKT
jgi:hypothetical protein